MDPARSPAHGRSEAADRDLSVESIEGVMGGRPVIQGTRITVSAVFGRISGGETIDDSMLGHPGTSRGAFEAAVAHSAGDRRADAIEPPMRPRA